jgi:hypothetical protein
MRLVVLDVTQPEWMDFGNKTPGTGDLDSRHSLGRSGF